MKNYKSIKIGPELLARMEAIAARYGVTVNAIARKAVISYERRKRYRMEVIATTESSTPRDGGTVVKVETDMFPGEVRGAIDAYLGGYESAPVQPVPVLSESAIVDEVALSAQMAKVERMTKETQLQALKMELGTR